MGKYEKDWSDREEIKMCEEMGGSLISKDYSTKGDILLGDTFFELKSTKKETLSFNTLANIGQNSLTDYGCFEGKSWSTFREETGFEGYRWLLFEAFSHCKTKEQFYRVANNFKAECPELTEQIEERSRVDREEYIEYLLGSNQSIDKNKIFLFNMLSGRTTRNKFKHDLDAIEKDFKIILKNEKEKKIITYSDYVDEETLGNLEFTRCGRTSISLGDDMREFLRISFHWKNKFQGCQTPCLNIFFCN